MISTRHRPAGWSDEKLRQDWALRRAVREQIRLWLPDHPRPPGQGWLYVFTLHDCPLCGGLLIAVSVPTVYLNGLCYCPTCDQAALDGRIAR